MFAVAFSVEAIFFGCQVQITEKKGNSFAPQFFASILVNLIWNI